MKAAATSVIVGLDEAGRGALAGPVVAGACVLEDVLRGYPLIKDSKQLTPEQRDEAYAFIIEHCTYGVGITPHDVIDAEGILAATERAMQEALVGVERVTTPTYLLQDGRDCFFFPYPKSGVIRGDQTERCIAAASILAKVTRDRMMCEYAQAFSQYGFEVHKGYGTADHFKALQANGPCAIHRRTFLKSVAFSTKASSRRR